MEGKHCPYCGRPNLKLDDNVWVLGNSGWRAGHFKEWGPTGLMRVWTGGRTSHTAESECDYTHCAEYSLVDPKEDK